MGCGRLRQFSDFRFSIRVGVWEFVSDDGDGGGGGGLKGASEGCGGEVVEDLWLNEDILV